MAKKDLVQELHADAGEGGMSCDSDGDAATTLAKGNPKARKGRDRVGPEGPVAGWFEVHRAVTLLCLAAVLQRGCHRDFP